MERRRLTISYFEGVNNYASHNISKDQELSYGENARSKRIGTIVKREGYSMLGDDISPQDNYGLVEFEDEIGTSEGLYRLTKSGGVVSLYYLNSSNNWTQLTGAGTSLSEADADFTVAQSNLIMVNGSDENRYVEPDGTVVTAADNTGNLYNTPKARKVNFYKERLYIGDFDLSNGRQKNAFMWSSPPLGIVGLVKEDVSSGSTEIEVTDTKYIYNSDSLDVYRGGTKIETLTITDKTETAITVNSTSNDIKAVDELWVAGTHDGDKVFRWPTTSEEGTDVKQFTTKRLTSGGGGPITLFDNVNDVMLIGNKRSIAAWNEYNLKFFDSDIGCVSDEGYVKKKNVLYFLDYTGIYATTGGAPELISSPIADYIEGATTSGLESARAAAKGLSVFFHIGDVTLSKEDGSTYRSLSNVVIEYNIRQQNFYVHTGIEVDFFESFVESSDPDKTVFADSSDYQIYEFLDGSNDDDGDEIPFSITTAKFTLSQQFEKFCYPEELKIEVERGTDLKCFVALDDGPFYQVAGSLKKGVNSIEIHPRKQKDDSQEARCRKMRVAIKEMSDQKVKVSRAALIFKATNEEDKSIAYES